jgi:uncharacterized protein (DUF488 family)
MELFTIGGYGHSEASFLKALQDNRIDLFVDIRQRRGMRGKSYSFLNATKLQSNLNEIGVSYIHLKELAPTTKVREVQKAADDSAHDTKRERSRLSSAFINSFRSEVLDNASIDGVLSRVKGFDRVCLFCVEKGHEACHRSVVAEWLESVTGKAGHI